MFIRKKKNRSGTISVIVVDKHGGKFKELHTVGITRDESEIERLCAEGRDWGDRFLSDAELARKLRISRSTLSNYRMKGVFGYFHSVVKFYMPTVRLKIISKKTTILHTDEERKCNHPDNPH